MAMNISVKQMIKKEKNIAEIMEKYEFFSNNISNKFNEAKSDWISESYLYLVDNEIVAFMVMMKENLRCGFLHYHISDTQKEYFVSKYPTLNRKINQVLYLYTEEIFRNMGIATKLLKFMFYDLSNRGYQYVWLKKETSSRLYEKLGFVNFLEMIYLMNIDSKQFFEDCELKFGHEKTFLVNFYNDKRLVRDISKMTTSFCRAH